MLLHLFFSYFIIYKNRFLYGNRFSVKNRFPRKNRFFCGNRFSMENRFWSRDSFPDFHKFIKESIPYFLGIDSALVWIQWHSMKQVWRHLVTVTFLSNSQCGRCKRGSPVLWICDYIWQEFCERVATATAAHTLHSSLSPIRKYVACFWHGQDLLLGGHGTNSGHPPLPPRKHQNMYMLHLT